MSTPVLLVEGVSKRYEIYERPQDRLKQSIVPRLASVARRVGFPVRDPHYFREFWALRDISLSVGKGEALGILGRNGAGKSTLLQIIAGTLSPTSGTIQVAGKVAALLELGSGFSGDFTGRENVRMNAALLGLSGKQIDEKFDAIAAFADIGDFIDQPVKTYSSGMTLRLAFAVQTAVEPDLLIVDEALAVGDARFQKKCFDRLEQLRSGGTTILFVTHDTGTIVQFCTHAVILDGGRAVAEGEPQRIAREYHRLLFDLPKESGEEETEVRNLLATLALVKPAAPTNDDSDLTAQASAALLEGQDSHIDAHADVPEPRTNSVREVRYGSKEAEIVRVGIRDGAGAETRVVEIHGEYEFYFVIQFRCGVANEVAYGFSIANVKGVELYGTKSQLFGRRLPASPEGAVFECRLKARVPFVPGTYFLTAATAHDDGRPRGEFLDYRFDALEFQIVGHPRSFTTCVADLQAELGHVEQGSVALRGAIAQALD